MANDNNIRSIKEELAECMGTIYFLAESVQESVPPPIYYPLCVTSKWGMTLVERLQEIIEEIEASNEIQH